MMRTMDLFKPTSLLFIALCLLAELTMAAESDVQHADQAIMDGIRANLLAARPGLPITSIKPTVAEGIYEVQIGGGTILHAEASGRFFFASDLFAVDSTGIFNVTETSRSEMRRKLLDELDESEMLVFAPPPGRIKATVTVFTDIDCGYCRKLHQEVPELNRLGIAVRYLAYPRAGIGSESYDKAVSAWCADDPRAALTRAKAGIEIEKRTCANPVAAQYALGAEFGVNGTPAVFYEDGTLQSGYLPAEDMAIRLGLIEPGQVAHPGD